MKKSFIPLILINIIFAQNEFKLIVKPQIGYTFNHYAPQMGDRYLIKPYVGISIRPKFHESYIFDLEINHQILGERKYPDPILHSSLATVAMEEFQFKYIGINFLPGIRFNYNHPTEIKVGLGYSYLYDKKQTNLNNNTSLILSFGTPINIKKVNLFIEFRYMYGFSLLFKDSDMVGSTWEYQSRTKAVLISYEL